MMDTAPPRPKAIPDHVKVEVLLRALGLKGVKIEWSHEPAIGLRAINDAGTDYKPPQLDPDFIYARPKLEHTHITFQNNGTGRGDLTAIAHTKRVIKGEHRHTACMAAKLSGEAIPEPERRKRKLAGRGFVKGHRPMRGRTSFQGRQP